VVVFMTNPLFSEGRPTFTGPAGKVLPTEA